MLREQDILLLTTDSPQSIVAQCTVQRHHSFGPDTHVAKSHTLFCPRCCQIWAILKFPDDECVWPVPQFCENCQPEEGTWQPVPGSLLAEEGYGVIDESLLVALPPDLLRREFTLHLRNYS